MKLNGVEMNFDTVMKRYYVMIYRLAYAQLSSAHGADDICQEVFLYLYNYDKEFNSEEHLRAWLFRVTINRCRKVWANKWYRHVISVENIDIYESRHDDFSELEWAVRELPKRYRALIHLYYYEELPIRKIAEINHQKESTVASALHRARKMLRKKMKEDYDFE